MRSLEISQDSWPWQTLGGQVGVQGVGKDYRLNGGLYHESRSREDQEKIKRMKGRPYGLESLYYGNCQSICPKISVLHECFIAIS